MADNSPMILVIDDEEALCAALKDLLELAGFSVLVASNGRKGIELFAGHADEIDVVLLDLIMPEIRGEAVLQELLKIDAGVRVILMSAFLGTSEISHFADMGFRGFLPKPFEVEDMITKVNEIIEQR